MKENRFFLLGLYLFNLGTVSVGRATNPFMLISCVLGIIIGGLCICYSLDLKI